MSPIRSFTALAFALGAAAAPAAVDIPKLEVSVGPIHVSADTITSSILPAAGTQLRREAALGNLPNTPTVNVPTVNVPTVELPNVNPPQLPPVDLPTLPEIPPVKPEAPTVSPVNIKPEPLQASVKDVKVPRAINTESIISPFSTLVAVPGIVVPKLHPRETALPIDPAQLSIPKAPLPTISIKPLSASVPAVSITIPSVADINPGIPKLPRRNIKLPVEGVKPTVDLPALSSVLSILGALVTPPPTQPEARDVVVALPAVTSIVSVLGDVKAALPRDDKFAAVSSVISVLGETKASLLPRNLLVESPVKVEAASTTVDVAALNTVIAVLNKLAKPVGRRDALFPGAELPSVTVDLPIVSSALSVLGSAASAGLSIKAARDLPIPNVLSTGIAIGAGVNVPAFTATAPIPVAPVLRRANLELPLTTLVPVLSKSAEILPRNTVELPLTTLIPTLSKPVDLLPRDTIELPLTTLIPVLSKPVDLLPRDTIELPLTTLVPTLSKLTGLLPRNTLELPLTTLVPVLSKSVDILPRATIDLSLTTKSLEILPVETKIPQFPTVPQLPTVPQ